MASTEEEEPNTAAQEGNQLNPSPDPSGQQREHQANYAQVCRLMCDLTPPALHQVFNGIHPSLYLTNSLNKPQTLTLLKRMRALDVLNDKHWELLFPTKKPKTSSETYDAILLTLLLKYVCHLPAPYPNGWSGIPATNDKSMAADVIRLQLFRTLLASLDERKLTNDELGAYRKQIGEVLERLGGVKILRKVQDGPMDENTQNAYVQRLQEWQRNAKDAEATEMKVEGQIRKKVETSAETKMDGADNLQDLMQRNGQKKSKMPARSLTNKGAGKDHIGMKPEELLQHEKSVLQQFQKAIIDTVYADEVVPKLIQRGILSHEEKNRINLATRNSDRIKLILEMIPKKSGSKAFDKFCDVIKYKHTSLYDQLIKARQAPFIRKKPDECNLCANALRMHYTKILENCHPLPWQPNMTAARREFLVPAYITDHAGRNTNLEDIFVSNSKGEKPRRILMEAASGAGKSTICASLAYEWSQKQLSLHQQFKLVFYIEMKMANGDLLDIIAAQCFPPDHEQTEIHSLIQKNQQHVLFILDGYENLPDIDSDIYDLIHKRLYPKSTVLLTAESTFITPPLARLFDTRLIACGLAEDSQFELIDRYATLTNNKAETFTTLKALIKGKQNSAAELFSLNPLFCLCMCFIADNQEDLNFRSMSGLLQSYLNTLHKVFCRVNLLQMVDGAAPDELQILTSTVEEKALEALTAQKVVFSADELVQKFSSKMEPWFNIRERDVFCVGLIQTHHVKLNNNEADECYFSNRIFQDFLAAHCLANMDTEAVKLHKDALLTEKHMANILPLYCGIQCLSDRTSPLDMVTEWLTTYTAQNQRPMALCGPHESPSQGRMDGMDSRMESWLSDLQLTMASIQESEGREAMLQPLLQSMPYLIHTRKRDLHSLNVVQGLYHVLGAEHTRLVELELRLDHFANYRQKLYLEIAANIEKSQILKSLKLTWTEEDFLAAFLARVFGENRSISTLIMVDESKGHRDHIKATVWSHLRTAGGNMEAVQTLSFIHCLNPALVTAVIRHIPDTIQGVYFDHCRIDLVGAQNLADKIEKAQLLHTLSLDKVQINRADFLKVTLGIRLNRTLHKLSLVGMKLDTTSIAALSEALKFNGSLKKLDLSQIPMSLEACKLLGSALSINQTIREVHLDKCVLSQDATEMLRRLKRDRVLLTGRKSDNTLTAEELFQVKSAITLPPIEPHPQMIQQSLTIA